MNDHSDLQETAPVVDDAIANHDVGAWAVQAIKDLRARVEALEEEKKPKKKA